MQDTVANKLANTLWIAGAITCFPTVQAFEKPTPPAGADVSALWQDRGDIASLDLIGGSGGKEHQPAGTFTFVKEDMNGTSPKFEVVDEQGVHWKAKLGEETKSETAAARLVWAAGYFTDEDYYLPELQVENMPKLKRGDKFVSDGVAHGVRMERKIKHQKRRLAIGAGLRILSREPGNWNGLRIMMALINNWDLKEINNAIYDEKGEGMEYVWSTILGATFGETGNKHHPVKEQSRATIAAPNSFRR